MPWRRYPPLDPRRHTLHLAYVMGRRGIVLFLCGILWMLQAEIVLSDYLPDYSPLFDYAPAVRALLWLVTGLTACVFAFRRHDTFGWAALYVMAAYRLIAYIVALIDGYSHALTGVATWSVILSFLIILSGWRESNGQ